MLKKFLGIPSKDSKSNDYVQVKQQLEGLTKELKGLGSKQLSDTERKRFRGRYMRILENFERKTYSASDCDKLRAKLATFEKRFKNSVLMEIEPTAPDSRNNTHKMRHNLRSSTRSTTSHPYTKPEVDKDKYTNYGSWFDSTNEPTTALTQKNEISNSTLSSSRKTKNNNVENIPQPHSFSENRDENRNKSTEQYTTNVIKETVKQLNTDAISRHPENVDKNVHKFPQSTFDNKSAFDSKQRTDSTKPPNEHVTIDLGSNETSHQQGVGHSVFYGKSANETSVKAKATNYDEEENKKFKEKENASMRIARSVDQYRQRSEFQPEKSRQEPRNTERHSSVSAERSHAELTTPKLLTNMGKLFEDHDRERIRTQPESCNSVSTERYTEQSLPISSERNEIESGSKNVQQEIEKLHLNSHKDQTRSSANNLGISPPKRNENFDAKFLGSNTVPEERQRQETRVFSGNHQHFTRPEQSVNNSQSRSMYGGPFKAFSDTPILDQNTKYGDKCAPSAYQDTPTSTGQMCCNDSRSEIRDQISARSNPGYATQNMNIPRAHQAYSHHGNSTIFLTNASQYPNNISPHNQNAEAIGGDIHFSTNTRDFNYKEENKVKSEEQNRDNSSIRKNSRQSASTDPIEHCEGYLHEPHSTAIYQPRKSSDSHQYAQRSEKLHTFDGDDKQPKDYRDRRHEETYIQEDKKYDKSKEHRNIEDDKRPKNYHERRNKETDIQEDKKYDKCKVSKEHRNQRVDQRGNNIEVAEPVKEQPLEILDVHQYFRDDFDINSVDNFIDDFAKIEQIATWANTFYDKVSQFDDEKYSLGYFVLDEKLMRLIEKLDKLKCHSNHTATVRKVEVIEYIKNLHAILDSRAKDS